MWRVGSCPGCEAGMIIPEHGGFFDSLQSATCDNCGLESNAFLILASDNAAEDVSDKILGAEA